MAVQSFSITASNSMVTTLSFNRNTRPLISASNWLQKRSCGHGTYNRISEDPYLLNLIGVGGLELASESVIEVTRAYW
ncbi:hypothetical protein BHYA_0090g00320 [Botrytis hyacinthi]|uniref:Uncharacterized protein n=1 Tax=Botrytis hyacinthi TaxID=278943 RepID=A0A4Z1GQM5_9HELO|nr:hypothetical protein BHYA_0090g00320 [Botrytis hyacinthi]